MAEQSEPAANDGPTFSTGDKAMIALAVVSSVIIVLDIFRRDWLVEPGDLGPLHFYTWVILADATITAIFLAEFLYSAKRYGSLVGYAQANWLEMMGLVPMASFVALDLFLAGCGPYPTGLVDCSGAAGVGLVRFLRFARIGRIIVAGSRLARAANMTFGEQVTQRLFKKYQAIIVAELTTPILIQAINITQGIVTRGRYADSVGKELDAKRDEIHALIMKNLEAKAVTAPFAGSPMLQQALRRAEAEILDTLVLTLTSDELNKIIQDTLDRVLEDFKRELKRKDWAHVAFVREEGPGAPPPGGATP